MSDTEFVAISTFVLSCAIFVISYLSAKMMGNSSLDSIIGSAMEAVAVACFAAPVACIIAWLAP